MKYRCNRLHGFDEILSPGCFDLSGCENGKFFETWRFAVKHREISFMGPRFRDQYPEFYDTDSPLIMNTFAKFYTVDGFYNDMPLPIREQLIAQTYVFPWSPFMLKLFYHCKTPPNTLGVSVRSWKAPHEKDDPLAQLRSKSFDVNLYKDHIKREMQSGSYAQVWISLDNEELRSYFTDIPNQIHWSPPEQLTLMQKAALKCRILGHCKAIIGDRQSTFIEAAWLMGHCQAKMTFINEPPGIPRDPPPPP